MTAPIAATTTRPSSARRLYRVALSSILLPSGIWGVAEALHHPVPMSDAALVLVGTACILAAIELVAGVRR